MIETIFIIIAGSMVFLTVGFMAFCWGQSRMRKLHEGELNQMRINCLHARRTELQQILADSDNGRTVDKVARRLNDVTNTLLEIEG